MVPKARKAKAEMIRCRPPCVMSLIVLFVAACSGLPAPEVMRRIDAAYVRPIGVDERGLTADGQCWAQDETPAVIETITSQAPAVPESAEGPPVAAGAVQIRHRITVPRRTVWFRVPCPDVLTPEIIGSAQRALAARGHYGGRITGRMDVATGRAVRAFQKARGLDSARLSLGAAQQLGLVVYGPGEG